MLAVDKVNRSYAADGILGDDLVELLSSVGPFTSREKFDDLLSNSWRWFPSYGTQLFSFLQSLDIPEIVPKPRQPAKETQSKRAPGAASKRGAGDDSEKGRGKRPRTEASMAQATPNPVTSTSRAANRHPPSFLTPSSTSQQPTSYVYSTPTPPAPLSTPTSRSFNPYMAYLSSSYSSSSTSNTPYTPQSSSQTTPLTTPVDFDAMWFGSYRTPQWQVRAPLPTRRRPDPPHPPPPT
ncbi:hypothetical protein BKA70DRAFT_1403327 [Coprinopsis sp. MPI-PUGE-AT-0042]|nr:hypothetical protein BKA70DRAFT_1403327 [Coprinopsis sp. MPI-PUGE-AT-0042]